MKEQLQEIWKEILGLDKLPGTDESFFDLGGNSFSAAQVIAEIEDKLGRSAEVADFYENETIDSFVKLLEKNNVES